LLSVLSLKWGSGGYWQIIIFKNRIRFYIPLIFLVKFSQGSLIEGKAQYN
jgi:hypothetical protein